jgi:hypothetical protein
MARTSWHPAFVQAIENELEDCREILTFETEYQLTTEPLKIDVLIIKKKKNVAIEKNIAQIFKSFNVVEYKSPKDSVTIENYHKTQCYSRLYASLNKVDINEMSVTVVATRHPRKLLAFLRKQYSVENVQPGIYAVVGDTSPTQIIVSEKLSEEDNFWLTHLREDLTEEQAKRVLDAAEGKERIDAYIYTIVEANTKTVEDLYMKKKQGVIFSEKLDAFFRERFAHDIAEREAIGEARGEAKAVLTFLRARFKRVPKDVEKTILAMTDSIALESWAAHAATCSSMDEFAAALK